MKLLLNITLFLLLPLYGSCQLLYMQDTYKGGISSDGKSYYGQTYLNPDTIHFKNTVPLSSIIKKVFLISERAQSFAQVKADSPQRIFYNNHSITFDSSDIITKGYYCSSIIPSAETWIIVKDVTSFTLFNGNTLTKSLTSFDSSNYFYFGFLLVILYEDNTMPNTNVAVFLNDKTYSNSITHSISGINPVNTTKDVGLSIWTDNLNDLYPINFILNSTFNLGSLYLPNNFGDESKVPGSFYYQNNTLFGLVDDTPDPFLDSTDALANIKTYITNNTTNFNLNITLTSNQGCEDLINSYILAYSTPCPARSNKDTTLSYSVCSGNSVQLNGTSIGIYTWSAASNSLNSYNIPKPIANPTVTTTYIALVDSNGCKHTEHFKVNVYTTPKTDSVKTTIGICGSTAGAATIIANVGSPTSYTVNNLVQSSPSYTNLAAGTYTFTLSNNFGCSYTSPKAFIIKDTNLAKARFVVTPDSGCAPLTINCTNYSNYTGSLYNPVTNAYKWYVNGDSATTTNFNYTFTDTGTYTLTLFAYETLRKCSATTTQTITVKDCPPDSIHITVPNIFSPNADGINDAWQVAVYIFNYTVSNYACTIYDRWGIQVFETNNISEAWSGKTTSGLPCSAGTYYYIIKLTATNSKGKGEGKDFKGYLELVR